MVSNICDNLHLEEDRDFQPLVSLRVLVVDDNEDSLELVRIILEEYGIQVATAASATLALAAIAQSTRYGNVQFLPHLLICDIAMPEQDGYWLIESIRTLPPEQGGLIPAIALTACVVEEERIRSLKAGFQIHLPKPIDLDELVAVVTHLAKQSPYYGLTV